MKLLISEMRALSRYVSREFFFTMTELISTYGWKHIDTVELWDQPGTLASRLERQFGEFPAVILFWEAYGLMISVLSELHQLPSLTCVFADDLHWFDATTRSKKLVSYINSDVILTAYEPVFDGFYPGVRRTKKVVWVPHAASPDYFLPFNENPRTAVLLSGKISPVYPLREKMRKLYESGEYRIDFLEHPGYGCNHDHEADPAIGPAYARNIHSRLSAFTCSLKYNYTVAKFFEIPATGSLLLADSAVREQLLSLGFVEHQHYIPVDEQGLEAAIEYVLNPANRGVVDRIRKQGQDLVMGRHTTRHRAKLIDQTCTVL